MGRVILTRLDGSTQPFDDGRVECGPSLTGGRIIVMRARRDVMDDGLRLFAQFLYVEANMRYLELGRTNELPLKGNTDELPSRVRRRRP